MYSLWKVPKSRGRQCAYHSFFREELNANVKEIALSGKAMPHPCQHEGRKGHSLRDDIQNKTRARVESRMELEHHAPR